MKTLLFIRFVQVVVLCAMAAVIAANFYLIAMRALGIGR